MTIRYGVVLTNNMVDHHSVANSTAVLRVATRLKLTIHAVAWLC